MIRPHRVGAAPEEAQPIGVAPGQWVSGVDFSLMVVEPVSIAGVVVDPRGAPMKDAGIVLLPLGLRAPGPIGLPSPVATDGRFSITDVVPGAYVLQVRHPQRPLVMHPLVVDDHLIDVEVVVRDGAHLDGRIIREGDRPLPFDLSLLRVDLLKPLPTLGSLHPPPYIGGMLNVQADGTYSADHVVGPTRLQVSNLPPGWMLSAVRLEGVEITDTPTDFGDGARRAIDIVLTDRVTRVAGVVTDREGRRVPRYRVVVFAENGTVGPHRRDSCRRQPLITTASIRLRRCHPGTTWRSRSNRCRSTRGTMRAFCRSSSLGPRPFGCSRANSGR